MIAERVYPWRKQNLLRNQFYQDLFWAVFNIYLFSLIYAKILINVENISLPLFKILHFNAIEHFFDLINDNLYLQIIIGLFLKDFIEWLTHNLLHRVGFLWRIHQLHHSIKTMDWIGNTRFHFMEIFVYKFFKYLPLLLLNISFEALLIIDIFSTLIGHLNHSNLNISWGPLKYIFNSPAMHIWHHDKTNHFKNGQNFGIVFSIWDWLFKTAYMPAGQPNELGFIGEERYPTDIPHRMLWPFLK